MNSQQLASSSLRYDYKLSGFDETSHYGRLLGRVGRGKRVLELGSSTGYLTSAMTEHFDCSVVGVEVDADAAAAARARGHEVHLLDLDKTDLTKELAGRKFDVVLCADVLEHLRDPHQTIKQLVELLSEDGYVICSIPHVGHADIRLAMLSGKLPYRPMGLLDHTHMKFFTRALVEELFESAGMTVEQVERNRWQATKTEVQGRLPEHLKVVGDLIAADPEAETYQFIVKARPYKPGEKLGAKPAAEATAAGLARVDVVVVDQDSHIADDLYQKYLSTLNYPAELVRFWFVSGPNALSLADKPKGEPAAYADNDFRTFRFISMGSGDAQMSRAQISYRNQISTAEKVSARADSSVNFASTLSQVARGSDAKYLFILTPDTLPGANCLTSLVRAAEKAGDEGKTRTDIGSAKTSTDIGSGLAPLIAARPEVRSPGKPVPYGPENLLSWHEFSCMLVPRDFLIEAKSADPNLWTSQAQAVDMCFRAWACGRKVVECQEANYFSNGQVATFGDYDITVADGLRLRRRWGSLRNILAFAKYNAGQLGGPFVWLKTANHVVAAMAIETPLRSALPEVALGLVVFGGPGASEIGHTAPEIG